MGIDVSPEVMGWVKTIAAVVAVLTAYGAKGDSFRRVLSWFKTSAGKQRTQMENMDAAWRELMDDSIERKSTRSVELLNEWMQCRTLEGMKNPDSLNP